MYLHGLGANLWVTHRHKSDRVWNVTCQLYFHFPFHLGEVGLGTSGALLRRNEVGLHGSQLPGSILGRGGRR